uniref:Uncharacterized protein n=1 Tax=Anopheles farauti TaxID=69004 RepID=A0A182QS68_9DIPT
MTETIVECAGGAVAEDVVSVGMEQNIFDVSDDISFPWLPAYAEATEASPINGASSRMLETIVEEETSDDDGHDKDPGAGQQPLSWSQYDHRRKQETSFGDEFLSADLSTIYGHPGLRRPRICEPDGLDANEYFMKRHNEQSGSGVIEPATIATTTRRPPRMFGWLPFCTIARVDIERRASVSARARVLEWSIFAFVRNTPDGGRSHVKKPAVAALRFDEIGHDLFTDSDSLSYASLSRSSSLIQFESLERQLQNETSVNQHPLSGSSPSLYTTDATTAANPAVYHAADATVRGKSTNGGSVAAAAAAAGAAGAAGGVGGTAGTNLLTTSNLIQKSIAQTALNISDSELYSTSSSVSSTGSCSGPDSSSNASSSSTSSSSSSTSSSSASSNSSTSSGFRYTDNRVGTVEDRRAVGGAGGTTTPEDAGDTEEELLSASVRCHSSRCSRRGPVGSNRNKNSIESLSEDSGYCDHLQQNGGAGSMSSGGGLQARSKSLTNFGSAENVTFVCGSSGAGVGGMFPSALLPQHQHEQQPLSLDCMVTMETRHVSYHENRLSTVCDVDEEEEDEREEEEQTRETIDDGCSVAKCIAAPLTQSHEKQQLWTNINNGTKIERGSDSCKQQSSESPSRTVTSMASSSSSSCYKNSTQSRSFVSLSAPDLLQGMLDHLRRERRRQADDRTKASTTSGLYDPTSFTVSSVPECLNLYGGAASSTRSRHGSFDSDSASSDFPARYRDYGYGGGACGESVASKNFNLYDLQPQQQQPRPITSIKCSKTVTFQTGSSPSRPKQNIRASYANLTALNYSDDDEEDDPLYGGRRGHEYYLSRNTFRTSSGTRLGGGGTNRTPSQQASSIITAPPRTTLLTVPNAAMDHHPRPLLPVADAVVEEDLADDEENSIFPADQDEKSVFLSLLEEMSAHFDRNLSIINDQAEAYEPIAAFLHEQRSSAAGPARLLPTLITTPPQAPPRRTQIKTNPHHPAQQQTPATAGSPSAVKVSTAPTAAAEMAHHPHHHPRRTFDQDPTNLVTCYAASLERCTFDPTETSTTSLHGAASGELHTNALPRYVPVPKKREFVASTPNLHYYHGAVLNGGDGGGVDDSRPDHHNSLRNVSTCRSTGSILATASSSRCGLSKGVSFCPIVSEIIWKSTGSSDLEPEDNGSVISNQDFEIDIDEDDFEADDLDHANLVRNTVNNGCVGEYAAASVLEPMHAAISVKCESAPFLMIREENERAQVHSATQTSANDRTETQVLVNGVGSGGADVKMTSATSSITHDLSYGGSVGVGVGDRRRMSESDPSVAGSAAGTGGVHEEFRNGGNGANSKGAMVASRDLIASEQQRRAVHSSEVGSAATMPNPYTSSSGSGINTTTNNTNSSLIKNFKNGKAEKKGKTFLSRISSGFRFSFRNKSKKAGGGGGLLKESASFSAPSVVNNNNNINGKVGRGGSASASNDSASADFIYIPLKDPRKQMQRGQDEVSAYMQRHMNVDGVTIDDSFTGAEDEPDDCEIAVTRPGGGGGGIGGYYRSDSSTALNGDGGGQTGEQRPGANHVLSSKPPLPKQPPRVVGVCAKRSSASPASLKHAHAQRASSTPPRETEQQDELDASTTSSSSSYYQRRSPSQPHHLQYAASNGGGSYYHPTTHADTVSVEGYGDEDGDYGYNGHLSIMGSEQKIGLIETNLDTHETIISGKTRSLMELGGGGGGGGQHYRGGYGHHHHLQQQQQGTHAASGTHQLQVHDPANLPRPTNGIKDHHHRHHQPGPTDGPGRPHKSMEFLLDKENQRNVLVSLCLRRFLCFFVRTSLDRSL